MTFAQHTEAEEAADTSDRDRVKAQRVLERLMPLQYLVQVNEGGGWWTVAGFDTKSTAETYTISLRRIALTDGTGRQYRAIGTQEGI